jgi:UDP-glucuronate 4-epimerase
MHVTQRLLARGSLDNLNGYFDVSLQQARLDRLVQHANFAHLRIVFADRPGVKQFFATKHPRCIVQIAAQASVRYSLLNPPRFCGEQPRRLCLCLERHTTGQC